jgi:hypothetical protein
LRTREIAAHYAARYRLDVYEHVVTLIRDARASRR